MNLCYDRLPAAGLLCTAALAVGHSPGAPAQDDALAVNHVIVDERLHTAGQPPAEQLATLGEQGFGMVINLAPPSSRGSIANEGELVAAGGASYVNIPVDWQNPTEADFALFSGVMSSAADRRVLVHCQMNMRASMFTFLYRVVHEEVAVEAALSDLAAVWEPRDQWAAFGTTVLAGHGIESPFQAVSD